MTRATPFPAVSRPAAITLSRRDFLLWSAVAGAGALLAPAALGSAPPLRLGVVGLGERGLDLVERCHRTPGLQVAALCDLRDDALREASLRLPGEPLLLTSRSRHLVRDRSVDAILLALPEEAVFPVAEEACRAGRPLVLARPVGLTLEQGESLRDRAAVQGSPVVLLPRLEWGFRDPAPGSGRTLPMPQGGRLSVILPAEPRPVGSPLGHLLDEADLLRHALLLGEGPVEVLATVSGPAPDGARELRAALRCPGASGGGDLPVDLLVRRPRIGSPGAGTAEVEMVALGRRLRLRGRGDDPAKPRALQGELRRVAEAFSVLRPGEPAVRLPLASALATARFLDRLSTALGEGPVTALA